MRSLLVLLLAGTKPARMPAPAGSPVWLKLTMSSTELLASAAGQNTAAQAHSAQEGREGSSLQEIC